MEIDPSLRYTNRTTIAALVLALVTIATVALFATSAPALSAVVPEGSMADRALASAGFRGTPAGECQPG